MVYQFPSTVAADLLEVAVPDVPAGDLAMRVAQERVNWRRQSFRTAESERDVAVFGYAAVVFAW